jgi:hypothetical protein
MFYRISTQIYEHDVFVIELFSFTYYDTVSYRDDTTSLTSLFIN